MKELKFNRCLQVIGDQDHLMREIEAAVLQSVQTVITLEKATQDLSKRKTVKSTEYIYSCFGDRPVFVYVYPFRNNREKHTVIMYQMTAEFYSSLAEKLADFAAENYESGGSYIIECYEKKQLADEIQKLYFHSWEQVENHYKSIFAINNEQEKICNDF